MKTTENISLAGYAFTIETDAYDELKTYLDNIHSSFSNDPSADEITADIEERIAELLNERCAKGIVVNINMIHNIEKRIGNPKELAEEDISGESEPTPVHEEKKSWKNRKIYRDIDERILGGVCGGLAAYTGIDKVIFRIIFLILFFIGFSSEGLFCIPMVLYISLWIAMPAARTVEQKCQMKGKPINLTGFRTKDFDLDKEVREVVHSPFGRTMRRIFELIIGVTLILTGVIGLLGCIVVPSLPALIDTSINWNMMDKVDMLNAEILTDTTFWTIVLTCMVTGFIGMLYGGIMLSFDLKAPAWKPGLIIFIAWLISLFVMAAWVVKTVSEALPGIVI